MAGLRQRITSRTRHRVALSLVAAVLFGPGLVQWVSLSLKQRQLDQRLARLLQEHDRLAREHEQLKANPTYVEGLIRSTFKVAQPGEYVIPLESSQ